jgi:hypothetical protein
MKPMRTNPRQADGPGPCERISRRLAVSEEAERDRRHEEAARLLYLHMFGEDEKPEGGPLTSILSPKCGRGEARSG